MDVSVGQSSANRNPSAQNDKLLRPKFVFDDKSVISKQDSEEKDQDFHKQKSPFTIDDKTPLGHMISKRPKVDNTLSNHLTMNPDYSSSQAQFMLG